MKETVKTHSFGRRDKLLQLSKTCIGFNHKAINIADITGIKYWVSPIVLYRFTLGWKFHIGFRTQQEQLDIVFRSFFGLSRRYFKNLCKRILAKVWAPVTDRLLDESIKLLRAGQTLEYEYCQLNATGVWLAGKQVLITWDDLVYEKKYDRLVLNSKSDHAVWGSYEFENHWNIDVLIALLDWLYTAGGLSEMPVEDAT